MITASLNRTNRLGNAEHLQILGFHPDLEAKKIHIFFARCVCPANLSEVETRHALSLNRVTQEIRTYTNDNQRQEKAENGDLLFDAAGDPVMIGEFDYWDRELGPYIYPQLQRVLDGIAATV